MSIEIVLKKPLVWGSISNPVSWGRLLVDNTRRAKVMPYTFDRLGTLAASCSCTVKCGQSWASGTSGTPERSAATRKYITLGSALLFQNVHNFYHEIESI